MTRTQVDELIRARQGCGPLCRCTATGAFEMPTLAWWQIGAGVLAGIGLGYVFFATK